MATEEDEVKRQMARENLAAYARLTHPKFALPKHVARICRELQLVEAGIHDRVIIAMPPRHGKSLTISEIFPAYFMGRDPSRNVIFATYAQNLANRVGRIVRDRVGSDVHSWIFPEAKLNPKSSSREAFSLIEGGEYYALGVDGPATGKGAELFLIDDPFKDEKQADSELVRDNVFSWYQAVALTRMHPGGRIVIVHCLTGDARVLMADGQEKEMRDVRPGDMVASYHAGRLVPRAVLNWANQGPDQVFEITMASGAKVRANERHPFLVSRDGEMRWTRLKDLRLGQEIVRVNGESGRAKFARGAIAASPQSVVGIAPPTTTRSDGPMGFGRHLTTKMRAALRTLSTATELLLTSIGAPLRRRAANAPFASSPLARMFAHTGVASCALITATTPERSAPYSATTATWWLGTQKQPKWPSLRPSTSDFTLDAIAQIAPAGIEDVYDIQIEGTENFIANGLVSHNTRWHEDDLIGRLLRDHADDGWKVISMPAICEDEDDADDWRHPGEALWPERFQLSDLVRKKISVGKRIWAALYQQKPYDESGTVFKLEWIDRHQQFVEFDHRASNRYIVIDTASVQTAEADYTAIWVIAANCDHHYYAVDLVRDKLTMVQRWDEVFKLARKWRPLRVGIEQTGAQDEVEYARERMRRENYHFNIVGLRSTVKKERRIEALQGIFEERRFHYSRELHRTCWDGKEVDMVAAFRDEYMKFPAVRHDDILDSLAWIKHPDMNVVFPMSQEEEDAGASTGSDSYAPTSWMAV